MPDELLSACMCKFSTFVYISTDTVTPLGGELEPSAVDLEKELFVFLDGSVGLVSVVGYQLRGFEPHSGLH